MFDIVSIIISAILVLLTITCHEFAHGFVSYKLGDPTPKAEGRLSLNPMNHIDIIGALCLLIFGFGWAKPVQVNPQYYKNEKWGMALTALAGPVMNFILAFLSMAIIAIFRIQGNSFLFTVLNSFMRLNIGLGIFNLIPIPPLDGAKVFGAFLPSDLYFSIMRYERYGFILLIVLLYTGVFNGLLSFSIGFITNLFYGIF